MPRKTLHQLLRAACVAGLTLLTGSVHAKRSGQNMACNVCHEGLDAPKLSVTFEPQAALPGQSLRLNVVASHPSALVGGVFVDTLGRGELKVVEGTQTWLIGAGQGTHSEPHPYASGEVKFSFEWVAPSEIGTTRFEVWSNAGNDNMMPADDSPTQLVKYLAHGCEGVWFYTDADADGFGDQASGQLACAPIPGLLSQGGDCDDHKLEVHPGLVEACNSIDDNCDGQVDEGFMPARHYVDADADGFGALGSAAIMGCSPIPGYAPKTGDCNDQRPEINPLALEAPNGIDDDCDSQIDEKPSASGGNASGGSSSAPVMTGGSAAVAAPAASAPDAGCQLSRHDNGAAAWLVVLAASLFHKREQR